MQELLSWQEDFPGTAYAHLHDWRTYDFETLLNRDRVLANRGVRAKPKIDIVLGLTTKDNLSIKWYPSGYLEAIPDWSIADKSFNPNALSSLKFEQQPDFTYFSEQSYGWGDRPANELLFLRGIGELNINENSFFDIGYEVGSLEEIIICTTRAIFNQVIEWLRLTMDVTLRSDFEFETYEQETESAPVPNRTLTRVKSWRIKYIECDKSDAKV